MVAEAKRKLPVLRPPFTVAEIVLGLTRVHDFFDDHPENCIISETGDAIVSSTTVLANWEATENEITVHFFEPEKHGFSDVDDHMLTQVFSFDLYSKIKANLVYPARSEKAKLKINKEIASPYLSAAGLKWFGKEPNRSLSLKQSEEYDQARKEIHRACQMWQTVLWFLAYETCENLTSDMLHVLFCDGFSEDQEGNLRPWDKTHWPGIVFEAYERRLFIIG